MPRKLSLVAWCCLHILMSRNTGLAQSELIFPVFANTEPATCCPVNPKHWRSRILVMNSSSSDNTVVFTVYDSLGKVQDSTSRTIKPFTMDGEEYTGPRGVGWLKIKGTQSLVANDVYVTALRLNPDDIEESFSGKIPE